MGYIIPIVGLLELSIALWMGLSDFGRKIWVAPAVRLLVSVLIGLVCLDFVGPSSGVTVSAKVFLGVVGFVVIPLFLASCLLVWGRRAIGGRMYFALAVPASFSIIAGLVSWARTIRIGG